MHYNIIYIHVDNFVIFKREYNLLLLYSAVRDSCNYVFWYDEIWKYILFDRVRQNPIYCSVLLKIFKKNIIILLYLKTLKFF